MSHRPPSRTEADAHRYHRGAGARGAKKGGSKGRRSAARTEAEAGMKRLPLRFPAELGPRFERLLGAIAKDAEFRAVRMSVSAVIRMALYEGLELLERRYGIRGEGA